VSIRTRIEDAKFLWDAGRKEGALLSALVAVAATSRQRFQDRRDVGDREAFERFLTAALSVRLSVEFRGEVHRIETIFYKWLRCELVHEGAIPIDVVFTPERTLSLRAGGAPEFTLKLSEGWFGHFVGAVEGAPENAGLFSR
jgi:hypothetical protein